MRHNRKYFYKYCTIETALRILKKRLLKYSSPVTFNDPFDMQTQYDFGVDPSVLIEEFFAELYRLTHDEKEPVGDINHPLFGQIKETRKLVKDSPIKWPQNNFRKACDPIIKNAVEEVKNLTKDTNLWWNQVVRGYRVFCVSETHSNLLMWAHYTRDHTGAVIKFECLPERDTRLCVARKVRYSESPPVVIEDQNKYIRYLTGQDTDPIDKRLLFDRFSLSKSDHWKYEKEWRVVLPPADMDNTTNPKDDNGNEILFDLFQFYPKEIHSIYLGCRMDTDNKRKIEECLTGDFEHVRIFNCIRNEKEYRLSFKSVVK